MSDGEGGSMLNKRVIAVERIKPQLRYTGGPFRAVRFFCLRPEGVEIVGDLVLRDGQLVADPPDSIALNRVLAEPVWLPEGDGWRFIYPDTQPEEFLKALHLEYHGSYFWAEPVED